MSWGQIGGSTGRILFMQIQSFEILFLREKHSLLKPPDALGSVWTKNLLRSILCNLAEKDLHFGPKRSIKWTSKEKMLLMQHSLGSIAHQT